MTLEQANQVANDLDGLGYDAEVHEDYSGRGMYGRTCVGISTNAPGVVIGFLLAEANVDFDDLPDSTDSMGLSTIYY